MLEVKFTWQKPRTLDHLFMGELMFSGAMFQVPSVTV